MQVILLETIHNLGELGDVVDVRAGYGRNFLIPQRKALPATKANLVEVEERRAELERIAAEQLSADQERGEKLADAVITIGAKAGEEGRLFGSIGTRDIADAITEQTGVEIERAEVQLPEGSIRVIGEFDIDLILHAEVSVTVKVQVVAEA